MSIDTFLLSADTTDLNYPEVRPTLDLNFARVKALDPRITFTRASGGSYTGADGLIKLAGVNEARFDHDPYTGESLGLLVEEARTNLITYSEDISQNQFNQDVSIATNQITSPDGTTTADKLTSTITGGSNTCLVQKFNAVSIDTATYTFSVFLKAGTSPQTTINLQLNGGTYQQSIAIINWTSNTIIGSSGETLTLVSYPNGWYRVSITLTNNGTNNALYPRVYVRGQGTDNVNGEFVYIWGWQTEARAFPTSYIPTVASTRTRAADNASITGKNFSEWYRQDEGTVYSNQTFNGKLPSGNFGAVWSINAFPNEIVMTYNPNNFAGFFIRNNNVVQINFLPTVNVKVPFKNIVTVKTNDLVQISNVFSPQTNTSGVLPNVVGPFVIGGTVATGVVGAQTISRLTYYPKRLPNAQLQALTR
jgi:hypothetical protein